MQDFEESDFSYEAEKTGTASNLRAKVRDILIKNVPDNGLSSDDARFKTMTGFGTGDLQRIWQSKPNFTTCNAFVGWMARQLGARNGNWLGRGILRLDWADKDVPGSWIPVDPSGETLPSPGDFYAKAFTDSKGNKQKFGHVGIVYDIDGSDWVTVDSGQGGVSLGKDYIRWSTRTKYDPGLIAGWVDIEIYFSS
jgi:hypothetical protein